MSKNKSVSILKCLAVCFLLALGSLLLAYLVREPLLTAFTNLWVIDEGRVSADAVVVFGGGANTRTFAAAQAYKDGLVKQVLIPNVKLEPIEKLGLVKSHTEICKSVVLDEGVPESAIVLFGTDISSTWEEVHALKAWCEANNAGIVLAPTEFPFTRRLRWVIDQVIPETASTFHVYPIDHFNYTRDAWWTNEYGLIDFQNDFVKYLLYRLKY